MMNTYRFEKHLILFSLIFTGLFQVCAQSDRTQKSSSILVSDLGLEGLQSVSELQMNHLTTGDNSIFIQQIGSGNTVLTRGHGESKELNLLQTGRDNRTSIDLSGKTVTHTIQQIGNENFFLEYGNTQNLSLDRTIMQDGNNQGLIIFGSNSLTDKLLLKQQGSSKTITIRNFN